MKHFSRRPKDPCVCSDDQFRLKSRWNHCSNSQTQDYRLQRLDNNVTVDTRCKKPTQAVQQKQKISSQAWPELDGLSRACSVCGGFLHLVSTVTLLSNLCSL